jgi:DNA-binding GntR family transcriptional regulator
MKTIPTDAKKADFEPIGLVEQIAKVLIDLILEGYYKSGDQLVESELQKRFKTSRSPIREAFRVLEKRGMVHLIPRRGVFVRVLTRKDIEEQFSVRASLEGLAARKASEEITSEGLNAMELKLRRMEKAVENSNIKVYRENHFQFHEIFINASHDDLLIGILKPIRTQGVWYNYSQKYFTDDFGGILKVHQKIYELFRSSPSEKKQNELETIVREHIEIAMHKFLYYFDRDEEMKSNSS